MHITIIALGSQGDVLPCVILGKGLRDAGYQVRVATMENFREMVESRGLELFPFRGDAQAILGGQAGLALAESGLNVIRGMLETNRSFGALAGEYTRALTELTHLKTDLIINQIPVFGDDFCEKMGVPFFSAGVIPLIRNTEFPIPLFPQWKLGRSYNALSYRLAEQLAWQFFRKVINRWRVDELGLQPKPLMGDFNRIYARTPVLAGFSEHVVPRPKAWGENVHVTGYWFPENETFQVFENLEGLSHFIDSGSPPIFVGFGSMPIRDPQKTTQIVVDALQRSGRRGILSGGWGGLGEQDLPETILKVGYVPYTWLLPQVAGSIVHGGSGSTASALRAGKPTLVTPFLMDQFFWGSRVYELGVGPRPIPFKKLNAENLAAAVDEMVNDAEMRQNAAELGEKIQAEDGVARAVDVIRKYI
jgi:UDP:flavonoid glycosyltransferase YjiC (YdhE family)